MLLAEVASVLGVATGACRGSSRIGFVTPCTISSAGEFLDEPLVLSERCHQTHSDH
jgi:hypothetical protein